MKRFTFSAFSILLTVIAIAPTAQALPKAGSEFKLQTLRLAEFDARNKSANKPTFKLQTLRLTELDNRNKSEEAQQPYYPQPAPSTSSQSATAEQDSRQTTQPTAWEASEPQEEAAASKPSITDLRHQSLDRS